MEVLRALLADGPIDDASGHATRILMDRLGRTEFGSTHGLLTNMARQGLLRRTVRDGRVIGLAATVENLSPSDRQRVWSRIDFPVEPITPTVVTREPPAGSLTDDVETLRVELEASRTEVARLRIQVEMFRAWANRMPTFDTIGSTLPLARSEVTPVIESPTGEIVQHDRGTEERQHVVDQPSCQFIFPHHDLTRPGQSCGQPAWESSTQWCWSHDPTPVNRRKAFPVRNLATRS